MKTDNEPTEENISNENVEDQAEVNEAPETEEASEGSSEISELLKKLDEATADAKESKERYLRVVADTENFRKRAIRDKEDARKSANVSFVEDLIPVIDNFKLGLQSAKSHEGGEAFAQGFEMILVQLENVLKENGVEEITPDGAEFDPNFHECVAHIPHGEIEEGKVVEVHRVGYSLNGRLIRAATVVVSSGEAGLKEANA